jgi:hypothetical protein
MEKVGNTLFYMPFSNSKFLFFFKKKKKQSEVIRNFFLMKKKWLHNDHKGMITKREIPHAFSPIFYTTFY